MNIVHTLGNLKMNNVQVATTTSRKSERRAHLIEVARALIAAHGLRSLKVRDVAAAAKCSIGTVYNEFVDLDELVLAVNRDTMRALQSAVAAIPSEDPVQQLHGFAQGYLTFASEHPNLLRSLYEHRMEGDRPFPEDLLDMVRGTFALMYPPLLRLLPDYPTDQVAMLARMMFSAAHGIITLGLEERLVAVPSDKLREQLRLFVDTYLAGLRNDIKPSR
jgi:AcrR family transcriptional regulator